MMGDHPDPRGAADRILPFLDGERAHEYDDLKQKLAEILRERIRQAPRRPTPDGPPGATEAELSMRDLADAVVDVIYPEIEALWDQIDRDQHDSMDQAERAEKAEKERDERLAEWREARAAQVEAEQAAVADAEINVHLRKEMRLIADRLDGIATPANVPIFTARLRQEAEQLRSIAAAAGRRHDGVRACRVCGCTDDTPCETGCHWVEDTQNGHLCSRCEGAEIRVTVTHLDSGDNESHPIHPGGYHIATTKDCWPTIVDDDGVPVITIHGRTQPAKETNG